MRTTCFSVICFASIYAFCPSTFAAERAWTNIQRAGLGSAQLPSSVPTYHFAAHSDGSDGPSDRPPLEWNPTPSGDLRWKPKSPTKKAPTRGRGPLVVRKPNRHVVRNPRQLPFGSIQQHLGTATLLPNSLILKPLALRENAPPSAFELSDPEPSIGDDTMNSMGGGTASDDDGSWIEEGAGQNDDIDEITFPDETSSGNGGTATAEAVSPATTSDSSGSDTDALSPAPYPDPSTSPSTGPPPGQGNDSGSSNSGDVGEELGNTVEPENPGSSGSNGKPPKDKPEPLVYEPSKDKSPLDYRPSGGSGPKSPSTGNRDRNISDPSGNGPVGPRPPNRGDRGIGKDDHVDQPRSNSDTKGSDGGKEQGPISNSPPNNKPPSKSSSEEVTELLLDEAKDTAKDKATDLLKEAADWIVKRGSGAVTATEITVELADETRKANLEHVQTVDGKDVGQTTMFGATIHAAKGGTAWEGPDGLWYTHPDPNYQPRSHSDALFRSDGKGDILKEGGNGIPDSRPADQDIRTIQKVMGDHASGFLKDKIEEKSKKPSYETDRKD